MTPLNVSTQLVDQQGRGTTLFNNFLRALANAATGARYTATVTWTPGTILSGITSGVVTVSLPGAVMGSRVAASFSNDMQGLLLNPWVSGAGVVSVNALNVTGGSVTLAQGTLTVEAWS